MLLRLLTIVAMVLALAAVPVPATADHDPLDRYAADTWRSMAAMVNPQTGLPSDNIDGALAPASRARYTSPTNVGMYLWATVSARHLGLIKAGEARDRVDRVLTTLRRLPRHADSGQFYNWYDPATGAKLRVWPADGSTVFPFLSSVDNGWLASGLLMAANDLPELSGRAWAILSTMDFGFYYDPAARGADFPAGLIRGGFWDETPPGCSVVGNYRDRGPDVWYTCHHYGSFNTEPRIASYLGIALGQIPAAHYFAGWRTFPDTCDWSWQEQKPIGHEATYLGVPVFEGTYAYRGVHVVPTWGGSMFEALMVPLVVPEETWGPRSWGRNHPLYVRAQIEHGLNDARYGYWGFSPSNNPAGGYREWGVDAIGMDTNGYTSDVQRTSVDFGFAGCPDRPPVPPPTSYGEGVVTPHASFLGLRYAPDAALSNLAKLRRDFDAYGPGGFYDAINVTTGAVSRAYLALDQGMVLAAAANALRGDVLRRTFTRGPVSALRPVIAMEDWSDVRSG
jgi:Putative glucoamylase/Protein of unknown function (DUF3131)